MNSPIFRSSLASFLNQFMEQPTKSLLFLQYAPSVPEFVTLTGKKSDGVIYDLLGGEHGPLRTLTRGVAKSRCPGPDHTEAVAFGAPQSGQVMEVTLET